MSDMTRYSEYQDATYAVAADIDDCGAIDMHLFAGGHIYVLSTDIDELIPYVAYQEEGTYYRLYNEDRTDPKVPNLGVLCAVPMPEACWGARWLKFMCSGSGGNIRITPKS